MKIFSEKFKTIILSSILLGLLAGNSRIFCMEEGVEFHISDEELDDIELVLDDGDAASMIEVEDDSVVENNDNDEKPKKEISKKRRFFVSLLKVAAFVVPAALVFYTGFLIGNDIRGYDVGINYVEKRVEALKGKLRRAQCDKNKEGGGSINDGDYLEMQTKLGDAYNLLDLIRLNGGMYKHRYYGSRDVVVEQMKQFLGEIRIKLEELAGVYD